jgi:hypothetical protein
MEEKGVRLKMKHINSALRRRNADSHGPTCGHEDPRGPVVRVRQDVEDVYCETLGVDRWVAYGLKLHHERSGKSGKVGFPAQANGEVRTPEVSDESGSWLTFNHNREQGTREMGRK